jgi:hypothetical protein
MCHDAHRRINFTPRSTGRFVGEISFPVHFPRAGRQAIQPATPISTKRTRTRFCGSNYPPEPATSRKAIGTAAAPPFGPETFPAALALSSLKTFRPKRCVRAAAATKGPARTRENKASGDWKAHFANARKTSRQKHLHPIGKEVEICSNDHSIRVSYPLKLPVEPATLPLKSPRKQCHKSPSTQNPRVCNSLLDDACCDRPCCGKPMVR